jgi:hypothetical protein
MSSRSDERTCEDWLDMKDRPEKQKLAREEDEADPALLRLLSDTRARQRRLLPPVDAGGVRGPVASAGRDRGGRGGEVVARRKSVTNCNAPLTVSGNLGTKLIK